jgi:hypothetical protein
MSGIVLKQYIFDPADGVIDLVDASLELEGIKLITNVTAGIVIYQFNDPANNGSLVGSLLTLDYNTSAMSPTDRLMIIYDAPTVPSSGTGEGNIKLIQQQVDVLTDADLIALRDANYSNTEKMSRAISGASYLGGDGSKALRTIPQSMVFDFSQERAANVAYADVLGLSWMSFHITLLGTGSNFQPQFSNDGQTWATALYITSNTVAVPTASNNTVAGLYGCPIVGRYARLAITATSAGRCAGTVIYSASAPPALNTNVTAAVTGATVSGVKTNNGAVPASTNLGVLTAVANAVSPTYTETFQTALSVDLAGALRTALTTITPPNQTDGRSNPLSLNQQGELRIDQTQQRRLQETQIVQSLEEKTRVLQSGEQYGGGNYGFEVR